MRIYHLQETMGGLFGFVHDPLVFALVGRHSFDILLSFLSPYLEKNGICFLEGFLGVSKRSRQICPPSGHTNNPFNVQC